jgi:UDP:flavonoid glycosyltransferase YjiC (YdhE family)
MLVVPYAHDQPDNALRARKLGIAASVGRNAYNAENAAQAIRPLLRGRTVARAAEIGEIVSRENGASAAADAIESTFGPSHAN